MSNRAPRTADYYVFFAKLDLADKLADIEFGKLAVVSMKCRPSFKGARIAPFGIMMTISFDARIHIRIRFEMP